MKEIEIQLEEQNEAFYEDYAQDYESFHWYFRNTYEQETWKKEVSYMCNSLGEDIEVLEVGSGTGNLSLKFLSEGCNVTAFDITQKMVDILNKTALSLGYDKCNVFRSTISDFTEKNEKQYDIVCESSVLHHIDDYVGAVESLLPFVKPGGFLYLTREPVHVDEMETSGRLSNFLHYFIDFIIGKIATVLKPFGLLKWHTEIPDHTVIAHHAFTTGVRAESLLEITKKQNFDLASFRKWNQRELSVFSHFEHKAMAKLRKDSIGPKGQTFWSMILQKS